MKTWMNRIFFAPDEGGAGVVIAPDEGAVDPDDDRNQAKTGLEIVIHEELEDPEAQQKAAAATAQNAELELLKQQMAANQAALNQSQSSGELQALMRQQIEIQNQLLAAQNAQTQQANRPKTHKEVLAGLGDSIYTDPAGGFDKGLEAYQETVLKPAFGQVLSRVQKVEMFMSKQEAIMDPFSKMVIDNWGAEVDKLALTMLDDPQAYIKASRQIGGNHWTEIQKITTDAALAEAQKQADAAKATQTPPGTVRGGSPAGSTPNAGGPAKRLKPGELTAEGKLVITKEQMAIAQEEGPKIGMTPEEYAHAKWATAS